MNPYQQGPGGPPPGGPGGPPPGQYPPGGGPPPGQYPPGGGPPPGYPPQGGPGYPPGGYPPPGFPPRQRMLQPHPKGGTILTMGILGLFCTICAIIGLVMAINARGEISRGMYAPTGSVTAGFVLSIISLVLTVVWLILRFTVLDGGGGYSDYYY